MLVAPLDQEESGVWWNAFEGKRDMGGIYVLVRYHIRENGVKSPSPQGNSRVGDAAVGGGQGAQWMLHHASTV